MAAVENLRIPPRRNVKELTAQVQALEWEGAVRARFLTDRYGVFDIQGSSVLSKTTKSFFVAGQALEQNQKPDKALLLLEAAERFGSSTPRGVAEGLELAIGAVGHGDLVEATFYTEAYGNFTVEGVAVWALIGEVFLVGGWIIGGPAGPGERLRDLRVLFPAGEHDVRVPERIAAAGDEEIL